MRKRLVVIIVLFLLLNTILTLPKVSADACGYISNVLTDSYEWGYDYMGWGKLVRLDDSEYYFTGSINFSTGMRFETVHIENDNGTITESIDEASYGATNYMFGADMCYVDEDIVLTVGADSNDNVRVYSFRVWSSNGTIGSELDYQALSKKMDVWCGVDCGYEEWADMIVLDNGVVLVAFHSKVDSDALYLISLIVSGDGTLSAETDIVTVNGTGYFPKLIALDDDTICVMFTDGTGVAGDGWLKTYDIDSDGDIGDADDHYEDLWEFETGCGGFDIENVYGDKYLLVFNKGGSDFVLKTTRIYDNGVIVESFIDNMTLDSTGALPTIFRVNEDIMAVAYRGADADGFIRSFNITYLGYIDDSYIDELEYWDAVTVMNYPTVIYVNSTYFTLMADRYYANDLYKKVKIFTYEIECATGDIGEIGSLYINCYDETDMSPIDFNITFFASDWGDNYSEIYCPTTCPCECEEYCCCDCTDSWNISFDVLPHGTDCYMIIGNGSYHDRYFRLDIYDEFICWEGTTYYSLCLPVLLAPESAHMYTLKVIDDYYDPIEGAEIRIKRFINPTIGIVDISTLHTDAFGEAQCYLIADYPYIFDCSKENYIPADFIWIPPDASNVTKTIKMSLNITQGELEKNLFDNITWYYSPVETYHHDAFNFTYYISSSDNLLEYYNVSIFVYNDTTLTWDMLNYSNVTTTSGGYKNYSFTNATAHYKVVMCFKKTGFNIYCFTKEYLVTPEKTWAVGVPDFAYTVMLLIIMIIVMGFLAPYAGIATGYIGLSIFTIGLFMNPSLVISGVSGWAVLGLTFFMYTIGIFLWSRL